MKFLAKAAIELTQRRLQLDLHTGFCSKSASMTAVQVARSREGIRMLPNTPGQDRLPDTFVLLQGPEDEIKNGSGATKPYTASQKDRHPPINVKGEESKLSL